MVNEGVGWGGGANVAHLMTCRSTNVSMWECVSVVHVFRCVKFVGYGCGTRQKNIGRAQ